MPLVSVVLIFLNEERFLEEAVRSVCDQTLTDWELILVDDGSSDRSTLIAQDFAARDERIRYVSHPNHQNRGMAASRNLGVAHSSAPYLAFIDGDDVWTPYKLAEQVDMLESMPDVAMVSGARYLWHSWDSASARPDSFALTGGVGDVLMEPPGAALTMHPLSSALPPIGVDLMVRRKIFYAVGGFEERFRGMFEDQSFIVRVLIKYPVFISSRAWLLYRQHPDSSCARTTRIAYYSSQSLFLEWLEGDFQEFGDPRLTEAVQRARRVLRQKRVMIPVIVIGDRLLSRISTERRNRLKRRLPRIAGIWRGLS